MEPSVKDRSVSVGQSLDGEDGSERGTSKVNVEGASTFSAVMNLLNTCIGVGILAVPGCFASSGIIPTLLVILLNGGFCFASVRLLLKAALSPRGNTALTLDDLGFRLFGNVGMVFSTSCAQ